MGNKAKYNISATFPFTSKYVEVLGSKLHYVDEGSGDPILFLHPFPASSYLWRNIIPGLTDKARCIAVDMIGFGQSDKPDIEYRVFDHIRYIEAFIDALELKNITLVLHAWSSVIGFDYARRHEENIKGMAFVESHLYPVTSKEMVSLPVLEMASVMQQPDGGWDAIMNKNYFIKVVLPSTLFRKLEKEEIAQYQAPFLEQGSCKPLWQYSHDYPLGDEKNSDVSKLISQYSAWLQKTPIPKLMLYAIPGYLTSIATVQWAQKSLPNLTAIDVGDALHYPQETDPELFRTELRNWYLALQKQSYILPAR